MLAYLREALFHSQDSLVCLELMIPVMKPTMNIEFFVRLHSPVQVRNTGEKAAAFAGFDGCTQHLIVLSYLWHSSRDCCDCVKLLMTTPSTQTVRS